MYLRYTKSNDISLPFLVAAVLILTLACGVSWWAAILVVLLANVKLSVKRS